MQHLQSNDAYNIVYTTYFWNNSHQIRS